MTLRTGTPQDIQHLFEKLRSGSRALIQEIIELVYFMRGAITYHDMMEMTYGEREMVGEFVKQRLDVELKKPYPVY